MLNLRESILHVQQGVGATVGIFLHHREILLPNNKSNVQVRDVMLRVCMLQHANQYAKLRYMIST